MKEHLSCETTKFSGRFYVGFPVIAMSYGVDDKSPVWDSNNTYMIRTS